VPYFVLAPRGLARHGRHAALLYGYGGFEVSLTPSYAAVLGATWLDRAAMAAAGARALDADASVATLYVVANVRGGGEFGPAWHQAALRAHRHRAHDDFVAVAEDLVARGFTSPSRLAIRGGSNGGLLVGNVLTRRPALCAAVVCAVPLLDMRRYHRLLAGASWQAEYGCADDADDWRFLQRYSAYHQIDPATAAARRYPALLVTTSTRDDRVHPYHARAFVKRLRDASAAAPEDPEAAGAAPGAAGAAAVGRGDVFYFENLEGGHGGAADHAQQAALTALYLGFLARVLLAA
jgi:prolyl oligopeptidase